MLHIGLIGGGGITSTHARAASAIPDLRVAAFYGQNTQRTALLAQEYGARSYGDLDSFLAHRPMDLVAIGSPSGLHAEQGIACARRGLHVLIEKPIDVSSDRARALIAEADRAGIKLGVFFQERCKRGVTQLRELVTAGKLGRILLADGEGKWYRSPEYYSQSRWRGTLALDGGGALMNQGIHTVDLLLWLAGEITRVQARMATALHRIEAEDTLIALLEYANGALGTLHTTTSVFPGFSRRLLLSGTSGTAMIEGDDLSGVYLQGANSINPTTPKPVISGPTAVVTDVSAHQAVLEDFIQALQTGSQPLCDGREAMRSLLVVEAIYRSARTGSAEEVSNQ